MNRKMLVVAVALAAMMMMVGCMTGKPWVKSSTGKFDKGGTTAEFEKDKAQCMYEAQLHQPNDPLMWLNTVPSCLRARGWTR